MHHDIKAGHLSCSINFRIESLNYLRNERWKESIWGGLRMLRSPWREHAINESRSRGGPYLPTILLSRPTEINNVYLSFCWKNDTVRMRTQ